MVKSDKKPASVSDSSIFDSLFGEIPAEIAEASIFSENNPFRRKPGGYIQPPPEDSSVEPKKRKKDRDSDEGKEPKRERGNDEWKEPQGVQSGAVDRKKKRKRDEVEAEYEARRYGVDEAAGEEAGEVVAVAGRKRKEMDSLKDVIVEAKEGFDDESKLLRTVFVGNLPLKIKKKVLVREFSKFGEVESVRIRSIPLNDGKIPRKGAIIKKQINEKVDNVHAYVVFKTEESAQASLAHNMAVVSGNHIRVDRACPPRKKLKGDDASTLYDTKRTLFVGNLPFDVKDEELYKVFSSIKDLESSIEAIRIIRDPGTSLGKGIAYVMFKTRDAANVAIRRRQLKLRDRDLRVSHAKADATPSKKRSSLPAEGTPPTKKNGVNSRSTDSQSDSMSRGSLSYQGVRASKSGVEKKTYTAAKTSSDGKKGPEQKVRSQKRPAVAARKAKALKAAQQSTGLKRKLDRQTPDTTGQKKKARKFA